VKEERTTQMSAEQRERMQDEAQNRARIELYVNQRLERPDPARFGGPENYYLLDNMEIAYALESLVFTHTFKHAKEIPRIVGMLDSLQELNLGYNDLVSIPTEIAQLRHLKRLILCENKLVMLPMLGTLENLVVRWSNQSINRFPFLKN
jgi:hypothetical protein